MGLNGKSRLSYSQGGGRPPCRRFGTGHETLRLRSGTARRAMGGYERHGQKLYSSPALPVALGWRQPCTFLSGSGNVIATMRHPEQRRTPLHEKGSAGSGASGCDGQRLHPRGHSIRARQVSEN